MNTGRTAIRRDKPSRPMKAFLPMVAGLLDLVGQPQKDSPSFFDIGCGRGDDMEYLRQWSRKSTIDGYDPNYKPKPKPSGTRGALFDVVTCIYVLNVLEEHDERMNVLRDVKWMVKPNGIVMVASRSHRDIFNSVTDGWIKTGDGWTTTSGTFQRGFKASELGKMLMDAGFGAVFTLVDNNAFAMVAGACQLQCGDKL